jgi:hypothetical protein
LGPRPRRDLTASGAATTAAAELQAFILQRWLTGHDAALRDSSIAVEDVLALQGVVRELLERITPDAPTPLGARGVVAAVGDTLMWRPGRGVFLMHQTPGVGQMLTAVAALLIDVGPALRRCETPTCRHLFAANRPSQKRCTPNCGGTARVQAWREKNRARALAIRHQQYAKKVRAQLPGARVARRKRSGGSKKGGA